MASTKKKTTTKRRSPKLTKTKDAIKKSIVEHLEVGNTIETSAFKSGIGRTTYYNWYNADEKFATACNEAIAKAEEALLNQIMGMAIRRDDWRAPAWILERRFPDRWGAKQELKVETNTKSDGTKEVLQMLEQIKKDPPQSTGEVQKEQNETMKGHST
jgi:hypothetical protein